jgi:hypothetical protein
MATQLANMREAVMIHPSRRLVKAGTSARGSLLTVTPTVPNLEYRRARNWGSPGPNSGPFLGVGISVNFQPNFVVDSRRARPAFLRV